MNESVFRDRLLFNLLLQSGLIGMSCQLFLSRYGAIIVPISMIGSVVLIPTFPRYKRLKFIDEVSNIKKGFKNLILLFSLPLLYLSTIVIYRYIKEYLGYNIDHLAWVFITSLIYFKLVLYLLVRRIVSE